MVVVGPGDGDAVIGLRTTFGLLTSDDRGRTWRWLCEELLGYGAVTWDPPIALSVDASGAAAWMTGVPQGLSRAADLCGSAMVGDIGTEFTADLETSPDGRTTYWIGSQGIAPNELRVSTDGGRRFALRGTGPDGVLFLTVEAAPSDPSRVYVTGVTTDDVGEPRFYRSDDGGATLRALPIDLRGGRDGWIAAVDPTDADTVYVRALRVESDDVQRTVLLRTTDGGAHFDEVLRTRGRMLGFAARDDGRTLWAGGPDDDDLLQRSDDRGAHWQRVAPVRVQGLRWHAGALYVAADNVRDGYALGRSTDLGRTVTPLVRFEDLTGPADCPRGTAGRDLCGARWPVLRRMWAPGDFDAGAAQPLDAAADVGHAAPPASGGGCAVSAARGPASRWWWWAACALAARRRQRRR